MSGIIGSVGGVRSTSGVIPSGKIGDFRMFNGIELEIK